MEKLPDCKRKTVKSLFYFKEEIKNNEHFEKDFFAKKHTSKIILLSSNKSLFFKDSRHQGKPHERMKCKKRCSKKYNPEVRCRFEKVSQKKQNYEQTKVFCNVNQAFALVKTATTDHTQHGKAEYCHLMIDRERLVIDNKKNNPYQNTQKLNSQVKTHVLGQA